LEHVFADEGLVRRLAEQNAPYAPVQRYFADTGEHRVLSQNERDRPGSETSIGLFVAPFFRGDWAYDEPIVAGVEPILHSEVLADAARKVFGGALVRPQIVYANLMIQMPDYDLGHTDIPAFRGIDRTHYPVWLLVAMGRSGLFEPWRIKIATAVTWWFEGTGGSFTYWPDGPDAPPRTVPPTPNTGVVGDNDFMFHRADGAGPKGAKMLTGMTLDSELVWEGGDSWAVVDGERVLERYTWSQVRLSVSWKAQVFADEAERRRVDQHTHDLSLERVIDTLLDDLRARGVQVTTPSDPLHDAAFTETLADAYKRLPAVYAPAGA
jgi:hypothetical protein